MLRTDISTGLRTFLRRMTHHRSITLTSEGTRFLLFALAVGIAAVNTGNNLFYLLLAMMLSLIVISGLLSELCLRRLAFRRHAPAYIFANESARVSIAVSNHKSRVPSFSLRLFDMVQGDEVDRQIHIPHLAPRASRLVTYQLQATSRGLYRLEGIRVATPFPFGLVHKKAFYPDATTILVCPELTPLPSPILQELTAIGQDQGLARRGPGMALYNLREYRPGDDSRAIHWMTTARTSKLMLKETEADDHRAVTIVLSTIAPATDDAAFERAVSVAASLATFFHDRGYALRAVIGEEDIATGTGTTQYMRILQALALCERQEPATVRSDPRRRPTPEQRESGIVLAVIPRSDRQVMTNVGAADCVITTERPGEPVYVARTGLLS